MARYFCLNFSPNMLPFGALSIRKTRLTTEQAKKLLNGEMVYCVSPLYKPTLSALEKKHGIEIPVSRGPRRIKMAAGDSMIILQVGNLPHLERRDEYTDDEVTGAEFTFIQINLVSSRPVQKS